MIAPGLLIVGVLLPGDDSTVQFFTQLARSFVIFALFAALYNSIASSSESSPRLHNVTGITLDEQLLPFLRTALRVLVLALALVTLLQEWHYDVNGLLAASASAAWPSHWPPRIPWPTSSPSPPSSATNPCARASSSARRA